MREELQQLATMHAAQDVEVVAQQTAALRAQAAAHDAQAEAHDARAELAAYRRQSDEVLCTSALHSEASAQARACRFECEAVELAKALAVELAVELAADAVAARDAADGGAAAVATAATAAAAEGGAVEGGGAALGVAAAAVPRRSSRHVGWADAEALAPTEAHEAAVAEDAAEDEEEAAEEVGEEEEVEEETEEEEGEAAPRAEAHAAEAATASSEEGADEDEDADELQERASASASSPAPSSPACHSPPPAPSSPPPDRVGALVDALDELRRLSAALPAVADAPAEPAVVGSHSHCMAGCSTLLQSSEPQPLETQPLEAQPPLPPRQAHHRTPHATRHATPRTAALHAAATPSPYDDAASCLPPSPWDVPPPLRELRGHAHATADAEEEPVVEVEGFGPRWISLMGDSVALGMDLHRCAQQIHARGAQQSSVGLSY